MKGDKPTHACLIPVKTDSKNLLDHHSKSTLLPPMELKSQSKISEGAKKIGNYILGKSIGSGTFGKVHVAMHVLTGQKVAVKIIQKQKIGSKDVQRVKNQIQILCTTRHKNLIHLYEIIQTQKSLLLFTQYMPNGQLFSYIVKQKKLTELEACSIFHQIIDGVQYLHNMGITHRDLKPENIMIDYDNQMKIIDFGLSRTYKKSQKLASACGSPCYAAPQMIQGKALYDPQLIDVWSCGVILYAMVCGTLPFVDNETPKLYKKIISGNYRPLKNQSVQFKDLIQKILVTNPQKRITIAQIKNHPWWNLVNYKKSYGLRKQQIIQNDENIIQKTVSLGFSRQKLHQSLFKKQKNKQTGAYFILMKKLIKAGQKNQKYIGDAHFNPKYIQYPFSSFVEEISQTAVHTAQCNPQMPSSQLNTQGPLSTCTQNTEPFQMWVLIGTKQSEGGNIQNLNNQIIKNSFLGGFLNKRNSTSELQQRKKLTQQQQKVTALRTQRKKIKQKFYGDNYKQLYKGKQNLKNHLKRNPSIQKQIAIERISTIDTIRKKEIFSMKKQKGVSVNFMTKIKSTLPNIRRVQVDKLNESPYKKSQNTYLKKLNVKQRLKMLQKIRNSTLPQ